MFTLSITLCSLSHNGNQQEERNKFLRAAICRKSFEIFRQLQILNNEFNNLFSSVIVPTFLYAFVPLSSVAIITILKFHASITLPHFLLFVSYSVASVAGIIVNFQLAGNIDTYSKGFITFWAVEGVSRYHKAFLSSCQPFHIKIGHFYFFQRASAASCYGPCIYDILDNPGWHCNLV
jgi:hypothetical protein